MEETKNEIRDAFYEYAMIPGRMISGSKSGYYQRHPNNEVYFNANIFILGEGKVWWGDLDLTLDKEVLSKISSRLGKKLYVLREMDGRFENENANDEHVLKFACSVIE